MPIPSSLLRSIGSAVVAFLGDRAPGRSLADGIGEIAAAAWDAWSRTTDDVGRRVELESLAQAERTELLKLVSEVVTAVAHGRPDATRQSLSSYLDLIPGAIRQALRRLSDPSGTTIPSGLHPRGPDDVLRFLPVRIPLFKAGDRPLADVDWELVELLGIGGSGEVWKAKNANFACVPPVALKFCLDPTDQDRYFRHEAALLNRAMPSGNHPGLVALRNTYLGANPPCLEYEYIEGGDLAALVLSWRRRGRRIPPGKVARVIHRLAKIVGHFHRCDPAIVHRDLKPANILIQRQTKGMFQLKVADFGIGGLAANRELERSRGLVTRAQLLSSAIRGAHTPLYASPEQIKGNTPDPRDDVHALGVIWYQMLCGDLTNGAPTGLDWLADLIDQGMSDAQVRLIASCFATRAERRPADARVLADQIATLFPEIRRGRSRRGRRGPPPPELAPPPVVRSAILAGEGSSWAVVPVVAIQSETPPGSRGAAAPDDDRPRPGVLAPAARGGRWQADDQGLIYSGRIGAEFDHAIERVRHAGGKPAQKLGEQLETIRLTRYVTKQQVLMLSKWCYEPGPLREPAQLAARRLFDQLPPQLLNLQNQPIPDQITADQEYYRWREALCGPAGRGSEPPSATAPHSKPEPLSSTPRGVPARKPTT